MVGISRDDAWSQYWSSGALHSCVTSLDDAYAGAIGNFWQGVAADIPEGARVLDVATGNGPVPKLLATCPNAATWTLRGIDLAAIHPTWLNASSHVDIRLLGRCALGDARHRFREEGGPAIFDVVTSQFGWEYITPRHDAIAQTAELTQRGGKWRFICHHADGVLTQVAKEEVMHADRLLGDCGLLKCTADLLPWMERAHRDPETVRTNAQASAARDAYNEAMADIARRIGSSVAPDLLHETRSAIHALVMEVAQGSRVQHAAILTQWRQNLKAARLRCQELIDHALSTSDVHQLFEELRQLDPNVTTAASELKQHEGLLGWGIQVDWSAS